MATMKRMARRVAVLAVCLSVGGGMAQGADKLTMRVSPVVSAAPAYVTVRAFVEADEDNRALEIIAESRDFYTSSQVTLNGAHSPRINEIHFRSLPEGSYDVTVILTGSRGRRALLTRTILVGTPEVDR
jgi:hypothetical protein